MSSRDHVGDSSSSLLYVQQMFTVGPVIVAMLQFLVRRRRPLYQKASQKKSHSHRDVNLAGHAKTEWDLD